jgi:integrase
LRRALADALRDGLVTRNVAALAEPPKMTRTERPFLTGPQARILIDGTKDDRLGPLFHLAVTTGMREAEILGLAWKDVELGGSDDAVRGASGVGSEQERQADALHLGSDAGHALRHPPVHRGRPRLQGDGWRRAPLPELRRELHAAAVHVNATLHRDNGQWVLADPKTPKSRRTIPLTAGCVAALREHRRRQLEERVGSGGKYPAFGLVFTTRTGWPMYAWHVLEALYAAEKRLKLPRVGLHGLRHSAATILYGAGVDIETIADLLGHSSSRITSLLYRHRVGDMQRDAAERMGAAVG